MKAILVSLVSLFYLLAVVPGILERYVLTEVEGHNVSVSVGSIPPEVSVQTGLLQVSSRISSTLSS